jgi:hypothetical protein
LVDAARYAWRLYRFARDIDRRASVPSRGFDSRIYLLLTPPSDRALVEGMSEHGGRVGYARAELDSESVDIALFVAAHELLHTLGALDHYGPDGRALVPDGLAEPALEPRYPQRFAEIMARERPLSETSEARLVSLDELGVGPATAREIGWSRGEPAPGPGSGLSRFGLVDGHSSGIAEECGAVPFICSRGGSARASAPSPFPRPSSTR